MKVKWGTFDRHAVSGAQLYVYVFQVCSLLPLPFIFAVAGYPAVITSNNLVSSLCDVGLAALPRAEVLALSLVYSSTLNELVVYFALLVLALVLGFAFGRALRGNRESALKLRRILVALIAFDLVFRLLPFGFNLAFGLPATILGWACRAACLAFVVLDLRAAGTAQ